jgi:hypothetical protein
VKITTLLCLAIAAGALSGPVAADHPKRSDSLVKRQQTLHERIRNGAASGELARTDEEIREEKHDEQQR